MADEKAPGKLSGWIKAGITSVLGLCSGAVLMYVSPLVNSAIKPPKPVANFGHQVQGLSVTFQNRSAGGGDGWWDFGDGSPLEAFSSSQEGVTHTYPRPGTYTAKLSLRNFLGDENERSVSVNVDGSVANPPVIDAFQVIPLKPDGTAPATFRVVSRIKNADLCIWSLGDDRPLDISNDTSPTQERLITLQEPGYYTLRLVAVAGKQTAEKSEAIFVGMSDGTTPGATLQVTFEAVRVEKLAKEQNVMVEFPAQHKDAVYNFSKESATVAGGYEIVSAKLAKPATEAFVKNVQIEIAPDKSKVRLSGQLVKAAQKSSQPLKWVPTLALSLERRSRPVVKTSDPIVTNLNVPGTTVLPLPKLTSGWEVTSKKLSLELRDGPSIVYRGTQLPSGATVKLKSRSCRVTATEAGDHLRLDVTDVKGALRPIGS